MVMNIVNNMMKERKNRYDNKGHIIAKDGSIYDAETGRFVGYEREDY